MKIALVAREYPPYVRGGAGYSAQLLVRQLRKRGIIVDVYVFTGNHEPILSKHGTTRYYSIPVGKCWPAIEAHILAKMCSKVGRYDIVHSYYGMAGLGFLKKINPNLTVVATLTGIELACINYRRLVESFCQDCSLQRLLNCTLHEKKWIESRFIRNLVPGPALFTYFALQRSLAQELDKYFAVSEMVKETYVVCGFSKDKIVVVPEMIDPVFFEKLRRQKKAEKNGRKAVVLYVGRLSKEKGVDDLIETFAKTRECNAELQIVGTGPQREELEFLAGKTSAKNRIRFYGWVDQDTLISLYRNADIFVHPGKWPEPFGRTILEAMLSRLAIIVSNRGAPPLILGNAGLVYRDTDQLREQMEMLIENAELRDNLGSKAYDKAVSDYNPKMVTDHIVKAYEEVHSFS